MAAKYISSLAGTTALVYAVDHIYNCRSEDFWSTTPKTVSDKEWWLETGRKFQAWPRTAGPPVAMNPITRQNFIVRSTLDQ